ncbi:MAG TPA: carboxypeptidase-like regulatory domain-containing protein, partial [Terriglobales bacterium]|nr:carboxypeptidase-like regulatory domain-containing protein [Terriglobales bacterium]
MGTPRFILVAALFVAAGAHGQTSLGAISGTVTDPAGSVVAGVHVLLTQIETRVRRTARSNGAGIYRFDAVAPGLYELRATQPGFSAFVATEFPI